MTSKLGKAVIFHSSENGFLGSTALGWYYLSMRKGYGIGTHWITTEIPGVDRGAGMPFGDTCPVRTLSTSSYSFMCVSSAEGLSLADLSACSHGSVFLTTAGCPGNGVEPREEPVFPAGKFSLYSSLHPQPLLDLTSENSAKPEARSSPPPSPAPAGTFHWRLSAAGSRKQGWAERAGPQGQSGLQTPYHSNSLFFQCKLFIEVQPIHTACTVLTRLLKECHKLITQ